MRLNPNGTLSVIGATEARQWLVRLVLMGCVLSAEKMEDR